jgi:hypothetical protein
MSRLTRARLVAVAAVSLAVLTGGVSYATIPGPEHILTACYQTKSGKSVRFLDTASTPNCKSNETRISWSTLPDNGAYASATIGNNAHVLSTDFVEVTLNCISANEADIALSVNDGATIDIDGSVVSDAGASTLTAQAINSTLTLAHGVQNATLTISFHNSGSSGTPVALLTVYASKPLGTQANKCFAQAHVSGLS